MSDQDYKKSLFISDIHMGANKGDWDWFDSTAEAKYLVDFFKYVRKRAKEDDDIAELVLLGDIFDLWVCPHDQIPHTFEEIVAAQKDVVNAIKATAKVVPVLYTNGNHDFRVTKEQMLKAFGPNVKHCGNIYRNRNIHAEHGHMFALFNRPDFKNGGPQNLPIGYFITRIHTTLGQTRWAKANLVTQAIDELFQVAGEEKLAESVLDTLHDACQAAKRPIEKFTMGPKARDLSFKDVRDRYQNLYQDWVDAKGRWEANKMILAELDRLGPIADDLCRESVSIVIFGHSHKIKMDKDRFLVKDRIYANCGYWCGLGEKKNVGSNAHFVQTDGHTVELYSYRNRKVACEKTAKI